MARDRSGNTAHLLTLWSRAGLLLLVSLGIIAASFRSGGALGAPFVYVGVFATTLLVLPRVLRALAYRRVRVRFLEPTPEALIEWTRNGFARTQLVHAPLLLAAAIANYRAFYGQFGRALDALDEQRWSDAPGLYRANMLHARALIHFLQGQGPEGLRAAEEAEAAGQVPGFAPGAATMRRVCATFRELGRSLTTGADETLGRELTSRLRKTRGPVEHLITLWASAVAEHGLGHADVAAARLAEIKRLAPHCSPLHEAWPRLASGSADATRLGGVPEETSAPGACARHPEEIARAHCVRCGAFACEKCARRVSEAGFVCGDCFDRYRELREANLGAESRLRAVGAFVQATAVLMAVVCIAVSPFVIRQLGAMGAVLFAYPLIMIYGAFASGRALRRLRPGVRRRLRGAAASLMIVAPVGTLAGAYLLWFSFGAVARAFDSDDYQRALALTPELAPRRSWPLAATGIALFLLNLALVLAATLGLQ